MCDNAKSCQTVRCVHIDALPAGLLWGESSGLLLACGSSAVLLVVLILFALALFLLLGLLFLFDRLGGRCGAGYAVDWWADRAASAGSQWGCASQRQEQCAVEQFLL